jgi:phage terminase small subunit
VGKDQLQPNESLPLPPPAKIGDVLPAGDPDFVYPEFLENDLEKEIFRLIVREFMPRNLARETDFNAYGRYAVYMRMWIEAKRQLEESGGSTWYKTKSKHGEMLRRHPAFQDMLEIGHELRQMEPQLALTPLSRNAIYARFSSQGAGALPFGEDQSGKSAGDAPNAQDANSPLGILARAAAATPSGSKPN